MTNDILKTLTTFIFKRNRTLAPTIALVLGLFAANPMPAFAAMGDPVTSGGILYTITLMPNGGNKGKVSVADNSGNFLVPNPLLIPSAITVSGSGSAGNDGDYEVTGIEANAFQYRNLTAVTIPASVETVGDYAFQGCTTLVNINLEAGLKKIGVGAFTGCPVSSVIIPGSVATIGDGAFYNCLELASITLEYGLKTIGANAFGVCTKLTSVTIPASVETIGDRAFINCIGLTSITIPGNVKTIGEGAFGVCTGLESITLANGLQTIGENAFRNCANPLLTTVAIPRSVKTIGNDAFSECTGLTSITLEDGLEIIGDYAFEKCAKLESVAIPSSVKSIGESAFAYCMGLTSITLKDGLEMIGNRAFNQCEKLTSITIPASVKTIGNAAFYDCARLTSITLEDGLETIGAGAFYNCTGLTSVTIPATVTTIDDWAFAWCTSLIELIFLCSDPTLGTDVFDVVDNVVGITSTLYYPIGAGANYVRATFAGGALDQWNFVEADKTAPKLTKGAVNRTSDAAATVRFTSDEAGTYFYTIASVAPADAASVVIADGGAGVSIGTTEATITLTGLTAGAKTIYIVVVDAAYNTNKILAINIPAYVAPAPDPDPTIYVTGVSLNLASLEGKVGDDGVELVATVTPRFATDRNVRWSTSDPLVATVTHYGRVDFVGAGTATITVITLDGDYTAECVVTVSTDTGVEGIDSALKVYFQGSTLYVSSSAAETIEVYSFNGERIFSAKKGTGEASFTVPTSLKAVIVRGSSGWTKKAITNYELRITN